MNVGSGLQAGRKQRDDFWSDQTSLVVTRLAPGIWEVHMNTRKRIGGEHVTDHLYGVVPGDSDVFKPHLVNAFAESTHARNENFTAQEVNFRMRLRDSGRRFAHAAADFKDQRRFASEGSFGIKRLDLVLDFVLWKNFLESAFLSHGNMAAA